MKTCVKQNADKKWYVVGYPTGGRLHRYLSSTTNQFETCHLGLTPDRVFKTRKLAREALAKYRGVTTQTKKLKAVKAKQSVVFEKTLKSDDVIKFVYSSHDGWYVSLLGQSKWICTDGKIRGPLPVNYTLEQKQPYYFSTKPAAEAMVAKLRGEKPVPKVFGYSYLLDMYDCAPGVADDMELTYRFLETLVDKLGMTRMSQPFVIHGPTKDGVELYPEKAGVSGWVPLIESGISIHSIEPTHFITLDVYSCRSFEKDLVYNYAKELFGFKQHEETFLERGTKYHK